MDSVNAFVTASSALITLSGTVTNALSLSYFIRKDNRTLGTRLLMVLNSLDLALCCTSPFAIATGLNNIRSDQMYDITNGVYCSLLASTAFTTCLLSVVRSISVSRPFAPINEKAVVVATISWNVLIVAKEVIYRAYKMSHTKSSGQLELAAKCVWVTKIAMIVLVVVVSNSISVMKILRSRAEIGENYRLTDKNKQATITVVILSLLFFVFNTLWVTTLGAVFLCGAKLNQYFLSFAFWLGVPLNSALNPVVYLARKESMRRYLRGILRMEGEGKTTGGTEEGLESRRRRRTTAGTEEGLEGRGRTEKGRRAFSVI